MLACWQHFGPYFSIRLALGMLTLVLTHVNELPSHAGCAQCPFNNSLRGSHKGVNSTVGGGTSIHIQQCAAWCPGDGPPQRLDHLPNIQSRQVGWAGEMPTTLQQLCKVGNAFAQVPPPCTKQCRGCTHPQTCQEESEGAGPPGMYVQLPVGRAGAQTFPALMYPQALVELHANEHHHKLLFLRTLSPANSRTDLAPQSPFPSGSSSFATVLGLLTFTPGAKCSLMQVNHHRQY